MKRSVFLPLAAFGVKTILLRQKPPILGTIPVTDRCNLHCRHCSVLYPHAQIRREMETLCRMGGRILFFCGGEPFLWQDAGKALRDLVLEAKEMGFLIVYVVTNGTFPLDLPEADLILLSLDGDRERHNAIRGDTCDGILEYIRQATASNLCLCMAISRIRQATIPSVCETAWTMENVRAVSFNFHTPCPDTRELALTREEKAACCRTIVQEKWKGTPVFNLESAFPFLVANSFPTPCWLCVVMENGKLSVCGPVPAFSECLKGETAMAAALIRMWLTRSVRPFLFRRESDPRLPCEDLNRLGLYVHIPFCRRICFFCPCCEVLYDGALCNRCLDALLEEIRQAGRQQTGRKTVTGLCFGGGTPAPAAPRLREIIRTIREFFETAEGIGVELHLARLFGLITERDGVYTMTGRGAFACHCCGNSCTLAHIDRMWGILRQEAFPARLVL